jgi:MoaA/NifB/PqqE/SkfB family radical SAM enzyme
MAGMGGLRRQRPMMALQQFQNIILAHKKSSFYLNLYFQGEPFLNRQLLQMISLARDNHYYTRISTNGHFLSKANCMGVIEAGLDRMVISLDGLDQKTYSAYRKGGCFEQVIQGIKELSAAREKLKKSNPLIEVQFLVNRYNQDQIPRLKSFAVSLGADLITLKSMQIYDKEAQEEFLPVNNRKFNRYINTLQSSRKGPCYRLWSHAVYTSDGVMVPCCYDKIPQHGAGNHGGDKKSPWHSEAMNNFRKDIVTGNRPEICQNCM